jgi:hypothetical protein
MTIERIIIITLGLLYIKLYYLYKRRVRYLKCRLQDIKEVTINKHKYNNLVKSVKDYLSKDGHDLCWQNRMELAKAIGLYVDEKIYVPPMDEFLHNCITYRKSLDSH